MRLKLEQIYNNLIVQQQNSFHYKVVTEGEISSKTQKMIVIIFTDAGWNKIISSNTSEIVDEKDFHILKLSI